MHIWHGLIITLLHRRVIKRREHWLNTKVNERVSPLWIHFGVLVFIIIRPLQHPLDVLSQYSKKNMMNHWWIPLYLWICCISARLTCHKNETAAKGLEAVHECLLGSGHELKMTPLARMFSNIPSSGEKSSQIHACSITFSKETPSSSQTNSIEEDLSIHQHLSLGC